MKGTIGMVGTAAAAQALGITRKTIYERIANGKLRATAVPCGNRYGKRYLFDVASLSTAANGNGARSLSHRLDSYEQRIEALERFIFGATGH